LQKTESLEFGMFIFLAVSWSNINIALMHCQNYIRLSLPGYLFMANISYYKVQKRSTFPNTLNSA